MRVTVFGSARVLPGSMEYEEAFQLGRRLAAAGHVVVSGGYGGVMEAVSRGAHEQGGSVVGITVAPWRERLSANIYVGEERSAATLFQRIEMLVESDALMTLAGGAGTLAEMATAWNLRQMNLMAQKPVILVGPTWRVLVREFQSHLIIDENDLRLLTIVDTIDEAVAALGKDPNEPAEWFG